METLYGSSNQGPWRLWFSPISNAIALGYQALTAQYGTTRWLKNEIAYFAYEFRDAAFARQQFELIGDHWERSVWRDRERFDRARDWSQKHS